MKALGISLMVFSSTVLIILGIYVVVGNYQYERDIRSYWDLADRASVLSQKSEYINQFIQALQNSGLNGQHDTIFFPTMDNSFDKNLVAVKSLQSRLEQIKTMDITSFQYQTAIEQITKQEQGEANDMLEVFAGCWWKVHYPLLFNLWGVIVWIIFIVLDCAGIFILLSL